MSPPLHSILSQMNPTHIRTPHSFKTHFNVFLPPTPGSHLFKFSDQNSVCVSHLPMRATCPAHLILPDFITLVTFVQVYITTLLPLGIKQNTETVKPRNKQIFVSGIDMFVLGRSRDQISSQRPTILAGIFVVFFISPSKYEIVS
jgi:hypothetical protein